MKQFLLHEHETRPFEWTERDHHAAVRLNRIAGTELVRLGYDARGAKTLQSFQHVGVLRLAPGRTVHIVPKIHRHAGGCVDEDVARHASRTLLRWLGYAGTLPYHAAERAALETRNPDWFEVLTRFYAENLRDEWRRGPIRTYISRDDDRSPNLVGRWRVAEQLCRPAEKGVFRVTRDEFSGDTPLNRVLRYVCEVLRRRTTDRGNRAILDGVADEMDADPVTLLLQVTLADADPSRLLSRLNTRYAPLLSLARLFLSERGTELLPGQSPDDETWSFTLDMNRLFEQFVAGFFARHKTACLPDGLAGCTVLPQARGQRTRYLAFDAADRGRFELHPDLVLRAPDGTFSMLLDTKYKRLNETQSSKGVAQSDLYQMFAYAHCFPSPRIVLLYPASDGGAVGEWATFRFGGAGDGTVHRVTVATIDTRNDLRTAGDVERMARELRQILTEEPEAT